MIGQPLLVFSLIDLNLFQLQIHANCRIRRVYFSDRLYSEDELPAEFKLYLPVQNKGKVNYAEIFWNELDGTPTHTYSQCTTNLQHRKCFGIFVKMCS